MRHTKRSLLTMVVEDGFTCSVCKVKYEQDDFMEIQESLHFTNCCGYGSVFGDMTTISLDICQYCIKKVLGQYVEFTQEYD